VLLHVPNFAGVASPVEMGMQKHAPPRENILAPRRSFVRGFFMKREILQGALLAAALIVAGTGASFAWGDHTLPRIIDTQTMLIRHTATKVQQQVAEQNARAYMARLAPEKKEQLKKKKVQYLAVPTVRSKETSPEAKEVLMIWDVPREALVSKNAYELSTTPKIGNLATYDNLVAEYIGKP
jgi:hypothetical protein